MTTSGPRRSGERASRILGVALVVLLLAHAAYYFPRVVDDLFISLRYAENLAHGRGAVYNPGERVEGFSGPSWMLLQALGIVLGFEGVTWTKLLGLASLVATAFGVRDVARELYGVRSSLAWVAAFACALDAYLVSWSVLGLETPLHVAALVWCPLAVHRLVRPTGLGRADLPTRRTQVAAVVALVVLGTTRPESALYVAVNLVAPFALVRDRASVPALLRRMRPLAVGVAILGALLALRLGYYGAIFPNTYRVKGAHASFDLRKLEAIWRLGASPFETAVILLGVGTLVVASYRRRVLAPALTVVACLYFTASVAVDWMPNLRHLLPVIVLAPVGVVCLVESLWAKRALLGWVVLHALVFASARGLFLDVRRSAIERGSRFVEMKSVDRVRDVLRAYRREEPPHVSRMGTYAMGQITQVWGVLETSDEPIESSWFAGRDIGAVGYYTGVRVFDTAGLFTPAVSGSEAWAKRGEVTDEVVSAMMATRPLGAEVYDGWDTALGRHPELLVGYRVRTGSLEAPIAILATDRRAPSREEILRRYRAFVAKLPRAYHLQTLYGETAGAAADRRLRIVEAGSGALDDPR